MEAERTDIGTILISYTVGFKRFVINDQRVFARLGRCFSSNKGVFAGLGSRCEADVLHDDLISHLRLTFGAPLTVARDEKRRAGLGRGPALAA